MKKIVLLLFITTIILSCSKEITPPVTVEKLDPLTRIQLNIAPTQTKSKGVIIPGTWVADSTEFMSRWGMKWTSKQFSWGFGLSPESYTQFRDTIKNKLYMIGGQVIRKDSTLNTSPGGVFDEKCEDNLLIIQRDPVTLHPVFPAYISIKNIEDTIGYIPNRLFKQIRQSALEAYNAGDMNRCYEIFQESFVFIPTTGAKWRALKAAGIE